MSHKYCYQANGPKPRRRDLFIEPADHQSIISFCFSAARNLDGRARRNASSGMNGACRNAAHRAAEKQKQSIGECRRLSTGHRSGVWARPTILWIATRPPAIVIIVSSRSKATLRFVMATSRRYWASAGVTKPVPCKGQSISGLEDKPLIVVYFVLLQELDVLLAFVNTYWP